MALSNFEISKTLTESDVTDKVGLPVKIVAHMIPVLMNGENSVELTAFDIWGKPWQLKYYTRPTGKPCPVLTAGWREYVKEKGVLAGDEFIFSRHQDAGELPYYVIQVKRETVTREEELVAVEVVKSLTPMTFQGEPM
ncbi:hypothetical protein EZV62_006395 [Acer yangbiense]|uniref:TF-B3 domain-containing protein n=1 Tax=Acer yangbiense TaxID=1000413 RepID=A0A5C7I731_9ROSI|nr:hypothetical protein EZV62_006395 [Acer yangbiense]